ncbi:rubrerythrin [Thermococcus sp. Bubb.Bath]|uniref:rubrerythrin n=1 Tax=Thermococcus sp. Bubb.Bath TaxID=1638242 RepID=UPI001438DCFD|nr:rubrerythrin [Thermococcus sp. Bubb.Bath]NJF24421.1 rubrerythrin [Thermococcus sp. Bubb.Bath]
MSGISYRAAEMERLGEIIDIVSRLDYRELLTYWTRQEMKKAEMYHFLHQLNGDVSWDERVSRLFGKLYEESLGQAEELVETFKKQFPYEKMAESGVPSIEVELSKEMLRELVYQGNFGELLEYLLGLEGLAIEVYSHLAENATDSNVKGLLLKLSQAGTEHYNKLKELRSTVLSEAGKNPIKLLEE